MSNKYVDFVSDSHFEKCVRHVCDSYEDAKILEDKELQKNGIDPIKMTFDMIDEVGHEVIVGNVALPGNLEKL